MFVSYPGLPHMYIVNYSLLSSVWPQNKAIRYGVPFVSKFMYFPWYHTMNSIIIPSILYNYIMHSIIYNPFYNIESVLYYTIHSINI